MILSLKGVHDFEIIVPAKTMNLIKAPKMYDVIHCPSPDPELCHNLSIESGTAAGSSQPCMLNGELTETQNLFQLPSSSALGHGTSRQSNIWEYFHINRGVSTPRPAEQPSTVIKYFNPQVTLLRQHRDRPRFREETHCHKDGNDENDTCQPAIDRTSCTPDLLQWRRWCSSPGVPGWS